MNNALKTVPTQKYKSAPSMETVSKIRNILKELDIFVIENEWFRNTNSISSVGLSMIDLPVYSAGKGRNESYALASAYAEFIERLQNLASIKMHVGIQDVEKVKYHDYIKMNLDTYIMNNQDTITKMFNIDNPHKLAKLFDGKEGTFYPYYNTSTKSVVYLPNVLIELAIGSNGMCAGNTPSEALIQGLCEIYERYVFKSMYEHKELLFPVIPDEVLNEYPQMKHINFFRENGYEIHVKDCSLDGTVPVVGVLIRKGDKALFNLGASPNFGIALERCLTELLQGVHFNTLNDSMQPIASLDSIIPERHFSSDEKRARYQYFLSLKSSKGIVNPIVFNHSKPFDSKNIFNENNLTSKETLLNMIAVANNLSYEVLIRNVSFLGFPTYQIYIPGMSEVTKLNFEDIKLHTFDISKARKTFFSLDSSNNEDIMHLINTIENLLDYPNIAKEEILQQIHNIIFKDETVLNNIDPENVLVTLYYKLKDYTSARKVLEGYLKEKLSAEEMYNPPDYAQSHFCLFSFLQLLENNFSLESAQIELSKKFEKEIVSEVYTALKTDNSFSMYLGIPECKTCLNCNYKNICATDKIKNLTEKLQVKATLFNYQQNCIEDFIA